MAAVGVDGPLQARESLVPLAKLEQHHAEVAEGGRIRFGTIGSAAQSRLGAAQVALIPGAHAAFIPLGSAARVPGAGQQRFEQWAGVARWKEAGASYRAAPA